MLPLLQTVTDLMRDAEVLQRRRYGVIEAVEGQFCRVGLRPVPKIVSAPGILLLGRLRHHYRSGDRCSLYYNQPWRCPNFLAVPYLVSSRQTRLATVCRALEALDVIARLKESDALLCDLANWRISRQIAARWGWQPHCAARWHRYYIKRLYGDYPPVPRWLVTPVSPCSPTETASAPRPPAARISARPGTESS